MSKTKTRTKAKTAKAGGDAGAPAEAVDDRRPAYSGPGLTSTAPTEQDADSAASEATSAPDARASRAGSDVESAGTGPLEADVERAADNPRTTDDTFPMRRDRI